MKHYETLMLIRTSATSDEIGFLEDSIQKRVAKSGGTVDLFDKWGKLRLAYPVQKQEYGIYILARYSLPSVVIGKFLKDFEGFLRIKCHEFIMRFVNVSIPFRGGADYKRPDAVDASPQGRGRTFDESNGLRRESSFSNDVPGGEIAPLKEASEEISEVDDETLGVASVQEAAPEVQEEMVSEPAEVGGDKEGEEG